jgi:UDP-N-acetyl-D-glucosamine dehydrogenase
MMALSSHPTLRQRLNSKSALVGIIGLGYVGLPLVRAFVEGGFRVLGFDSDGAKIARLRSGESYIASLDSAWVQEQIAARTFAVTGDMQRLAEPDAILMCVPTPLTASRAPDLSYVEATTNQIAAVLRAGQLIVLESTTYPGTTRDLVLPILEQSQLTHGQDFFLAYSPEREDPGNAKFSARNIPKVVGGMDSASLELALALYAPVVLDTVAVSSCEVAEASKILENTYRCVNIALVNELKVLFARMGIDVWEVIAAASTKPFGFQAFYPGPGLGGHCIPIDPFYLSWIAKKYESPTRFIELAGEVNTAMPDYVVQQVILALNEMHKPVRGSRIAILGVAYKRDIDDPRESPAFKIIEALQQLGAVLSYHDPHIPELPTMRHYRVPPLSSQPLTKEFVQSQDCLVIATDHSQVDYHFIAEHAGLVVDTRNVMPQGVGKCKVVKA